MRTKVRKRPLSLREWLDRVLLERGRLVAKELVDEARSKRSPGHRFFEWNDRQGAEKFRLLQAAHYCRKYTIAHEKSDSEYSRPQRAVIHIEYHDGVSCWRSKEEVQRDPALRRYALEEAVRMLVGLRQRYEEIAELAFVWEKVCDAESMFLKVKRQKGRKR